MIVCRMLLAALFLLGWHHTGAHAQSESRVALVIGNANYVNFTKLKNPANDAAAMAATLRKLGFEVIEQENVTRRAMIQATRTFVDKISPGGIGLVFYSGHGIQSQGTNYILPIDVALAVEDDLKYEAIDVQDILNKLSDARVRLSLVILDACRDNPFKGFRSASHGLAQLDPPRGTVIAYSTSPGKVAADGTGNNSVYTAELIKAMSQPGWKLMDVFEHVTDAVEQQTADAQTPWVNSSFRGDFYFLGPTTLTVVPPPESNFLTPEIVFWQSIAASTNPSDFDAYLKQFPHGSFVVLAQIRLAALRPTSSPAPVAAQNAPPAPSTPATPPAPSTVIEPNRADKDSTGTYFVLPSAPKGRSTLMTRLVTDMPAVTKGREDIVRRYLEQKHFRAFAIAPEKHASWWSAEWPTPEIAKERTLEGCQARYGTPCLLFAYDDEVIASPSAGHEWPRADMLRVRYSGPFDPAQIPSLRDTTRSGPTVAGYAAAPQPKAMAFHPWGRVFTATGAATQTVAEEQALAACNSDKVRNGQDGPCFLYAVSNQVVLPRRLTGPDPYSRISDAASLLRSSSSYGPAAYSHDRGQLGYADLPGKKALALHVESGGIFYWYGTDTQELAEQLALEGCQQNYNGPCVLLASGEELLAPDPRRATRHDMERLHYRGVFKPEKVPFLKLSADLRNYLSFPDNKAIAVRARGARASIVSGAASVREAERQALANCNADASEKTCVLYASGNQVVLLDRWTSPRP